MLDFEFCILILFNCIQTEEESHTPALQVMSVLAILPNPIHTVKGLRLKHKRR